MQYIATTDKNGMGVVLSFDESGVMKQVYPEVAVETPVEIAPVTPETPVVEAEVVA